jgi:hypothetical protein
MSNPVKWPEDGTPLDYQSLADAIMKAIRFAYDLTRKNPHRSVPWVGPPIGQNERANSLEARERLSAAQLKYSEENQGRDALDEIIGVAIQIGIEQGRRIYRNSDGFKTLMLRLGTYRMGLERLSSMEAFEGARIIDAQRDKELLARVDYARKFASLRQLDDPDDDAHG